MPPPQHATRYPTIYCPQNSFFQLALFRRLRVWNTRDILAAWRTGAHGYGKYTGCTSLDERNDSAEVVHASKPKPDIVDRKPQERRSSSSEMCWHLVIPWHPAHPTSCRRVARTCLVFKSIQSKIRSPSTYLHRYSIF